MLQMSLDPLHLLERSSSITRHLFISTTVQQRGSGLIMDWVPKGMFGIA